MMPESSNLEAIGHPPCRCLHAKDMFIQTEQNPGVPSTSSGIYWCIHTFNCLGPDGQVAQPAACKPGRRCYDLG